MTSFSGGTFGERSYLRSSALHGSADKQVQEVLQRGIFSDVPSGHEHAYAIAYLKRAGLVSGYDDGTFRPNETVSRAEVTVFLARSLRADPYHGRYAHCFTDTGSEWYARFVCFAKSKGWVAGDTVVAGDAGNTQQVARGFEPMKPALVQEALDMLQKALLAGNETALAAFSVKAAALKPDAVITRGQMAQLLFEALLQARPAL